MKATVYSVFTSVYFIICSLEMSGLDDEEGEWSVTDPALGGLLDANAVVAAPARHGRTVVFDNETSTNGHLSRPGVVWRIPLLGGTITRHTFVELLA
jgi:hypothetical protein